jgi:hypothetical protein
MHPLDPMVRKLEARCRLTPGKQRTSNAMSSTRHCKFQGACQRHPSNDNLDAKPECVCDPRTSCVAHASKPSCRDPSNMAGDESSHFRPSLLKEPWLVSSRCLPGKPAMTIHADTPARSAARHGWDSYCLTVLRRGVMSAYGTNQPGYDGRKRALRALFVIHTCVKLLII